MTPEPLLGGNRTGIALAPERADEMVHGFDEFEPTSHTGERELAQMHVREAKDAPSLGSLPEPKKGGKMDPKDATHAVLMDKLGERLAFERTGARLYEAMLAKLDAHGTFDGGPTREQLDDIRAEERSHFEMLTKCITQLGGDPTAVTPSADLAGVSSSGIAKVICDPRTDVVQCLDALLVAELTDNAGWETLIELAREAGQDEIVPRFQKAREREEEHLEEVQSWLQAGLGLP